MRRWLPRNCPRHVTRNLGGRLILSVSVPRRQPVPERAAGYHEQNEAQQEDQNGLPALSCLIECCRIRKHPIDPDRIRDVLDLAVSERLISANQLVLDLLV